MSDVIKLVQGDNRPEITITVTDESTGNVVSLAGATEAMRFRKKGTETVLATLVGTHVTDGTDGRTRFSFTGSALDVEAGLYEGEVEITFAGGDKQTIYDTLQFRVREQFG